jgi:outer membrane protein TolC
VVQGIILDVKQALRQLDTNYRLIEQTRIARLAATENLRTLEVQKQTIRGLTPEFLDLELSRQEALAQAELREIGALTDYNLALAQYYAATGTTLQIRGIVVEPPTAQQLIDAGPRAPRR